MQSKVPRMIQKVTFSLKRKMEKGRTKRGEMLERIVALAAPIR